MAQFIFGLAVLVGIVTGWYAKAQYDYSKTPQEDLAMGFELKWYKYGPTTLLALVTSIGSFILGLTLL